MKRIFVASKGVGDWKPVSGIAAEIDNTRKMLYATA
jgi:hypothetical protein